MCLFRCRSYAVFSWSLPGAQPASVKTETSKGKTPEYNHRARLSFERGKKSSRTFFERRRATVEVFREPHGMQKWFGKDTELIGRAEFKVETLLSRAQLLADVPLKLPDAPEKGTVGFLKLELRLQTALDDEPPAPVGPSAKARSASMASQPEQSAPRQRAAPKPAVEDEDDFEYANRIVSYNVLEFEINRMKTGIATLEEKGAIVPLAFGNRLQALDFRRDFLQIQARESTRRKAMST